MHKKEYEIGILYGEGIGFEVLTETKKILNIIAEKFNLKFKFLEGPHVKYKYPLKNKRGVVGPIYSFYNYAINNNIPILSGPLSGGLVYNIRKRFDLFFKLVPLQSIPGVRSNIFKHPVDILLIRQNNTGEYFGKHGLIKDKNGLRIAYQNIKYFENDISRIADATFKFTSNIKRKITVLLKEDGLPDISKLWREIFENKQQKYPNVILEFINVDTGVGNIIANPSNFDIVVTLNYDGDIITDALVSYILGSRGMGCSGNFNDNNFGSYQTIHGGAIDIAGKNKANPIGQILSAAMMLEYSFGLKRESNVIKKGIEIVLSRGYRTVDFRSSKKLVSTEKMGSLIAETITKLKG